MGKRKEKENKEESLTQVVQKHNFKVPEKQHTNIINNPDKNIDTNITELNQVFNERYAIYKEVLSPQLEENEKLKRQQKTELMSNIFAFLKWQFFATYAFIFGFILIIACKTNLGISDNVIIHIFNFLKFYITTIVAELIAILFFIVKNVFDKSITDLFKNFDKKDT